MPRLSSHPLLSIVVTSYTMDRFRDLCDLLDSIKVQTYPIVEVIFVAERSKKLLGEVQAYVKRNGLWNVRIISNEDHWGLSESRNLGIKESKGDIIAFVDDDVVLSRTWAEEIMKTFGKDDGIIGVTGPALPLWEDKSLSWLPVEFHWLISCTTWFDQKGIMPIRNVWGHNMAFKKESFNVCGLLPAEFGYHRGAMAEDLGFSMKVRMKTGKRIVHNSEIEVLHKVHTYRLSWRFIAERSRWIGHSRRMLKSFYKGRDEGLFDMENSLLRRIMVNLPIRILRTIFSRPIEVLKTLSVTIVILISVALGYLE